MEGESLSLGRCIGLMHTILLSMPKMRWVQGAVLENAPFRVRFANDVLGERSLLGGESERERERQRDRETERERRGERERSFIDNEKGSSAHLRDASYGVGDEIR